MVRMREEAIDTVLVKGQGEANFTPVRCGGVAGMWIFFSMQRTTSG